jgi:hypothetical protein
MAHGWATMHLELDQFGTQSLVLVAAPLVFHLETHQNTPAKR